MASHKDPANERTHDQPVDRRRVGIEHPNRERRAVGPHPARGGKSAPRLRAGKH